MRIPSPKIKAHLQNYVYDWTRRRLSMFQSDVISMRLKESDDWSSMIPLFGKGLTEAGIQRINESIRTYVYCILGAQVMLKQDIMNIDVQRQFGTLVEDAISGIRLVDSIRTFESTLKKTGSKLDYAIGPNLQKMPSSMKLKFGYTVVDPDIPLTGHDIEPPKSTNHVTLTGALLLAISLFELIF